MKVASSILSWIGGLLTIAAMWVCYILFAVLAKFYDLTAYAMILLIPFIVDTTFILAILIVRQCVMGKKAQIPFGILTLIFASLLGGIFTLCIPLDSKKKKEKRTHYYDIEENGRKYKYIRPIPEKILSCKRTLLNSANDHEYSKNTELRAVKLAHGVERLEIGAFANCINLVTITLPKSVKYIGTNCFFNCKKLRYIIYNGEQLDWAKISRGSNWLLRAGTVSIYCDDGSITVDPNR